MTWEKIIYPLPLKKGSVIGVTALSSGVAVPYHPRLDLVLQHLRERAFEFKEGKCLRNDFKSVSGSSIERADDFQNFWNDPSIDAIIPPWGGELIINLLPHISFERLSKNPKWLLGYSDLSTLLFAITLRTGISTAHGLNLMDAVINQKDGLSEHTYQILSIKSGDSITQNSSEKFQLHFKDFTKDVGVTFNLSEKTQWKCLDGSQEHEFSGRIIGGCLDTLRNLIGTPYGNLNEFASRFKNDGLILYLENSGSTPSEVCRALWNMKLAGWFNSINGIILGRSSGPNATRADQFSYKDALHDMFDLESFPVIYDVDIGHQPPQLTILNGSLASIHYKNGSGSLRQSLI